MSIRGILLCGAACLISAAASAATLSVGPGKTYATVAAAVAASHSGDSIEVQTGTYTNDFVTITTNLSIKAVGGRVSMVATVPVSSAKGIWVVGTSVTSPTVTIDGFDFSGATTPSGNNAAGVMYQSGFLTLSNDSFHNNQDGVRGGPIGSGVVLIDHCEFYSNGINDGLTHDIYIGVMPQFTIQNSYIHDALGGHEIKSRALNTVVSNNRIFDNSSSSSYSVDIPQSGNVTITNNIIQQGTAAANPSILAYGEETGVTQNPGRTISVSNNTIINDLTAQTPVVMFNFSSATAVLTNNSYWGITAPQIPGGTGPTTSTGDVFLGSRPTLDTTTHPYKTAYITPQTLAVLNNKLLMTGFKLSMVAPGTQGGGGSGGAFALVDGSGIPLTDGVPRVLTSQ